MTNKTQSKINDLGNKILRDSSDRNVLIKLKNLLPIPEDEYANTNRALQYCYCLSLLCIIIRLIYYKHEVIFAILPEDKAWIMIEREVLKQLEEGQYPINPTEQQ